MSYCGKFATILGAKTFMPFWFVLSASGFFCKILSTSVQHKEENRDSYQHVNHKPIVTFKTQNLSDDFQVKSVSTVFVRFGLSPRCCQPLLLQIYSMNIPSLSCRTLAWVKQVINKHCRFTFPLLIYSTLIFTKSHF